MTELEDIVCKEKRPFENIYATLKSLDTGPFRKLLKQDMLKDRQYDDFRRLLKHTTKGIGHLHYATMKFSFRPYESAVGVLGGEISGGVTGVAVGAALLGPAGVVIGGYMGMCGGIILGAATGSPVFHAWNKTIGKATRKKYVASLDDNFRDLYRLSNKLDEQIRYGGISDKALKRLGKKGLAKLPGIIEDATANLGRVKRSYKEYGEIKWKTI